MNPECESLINFVDPDSLSIIDDYITGLKKHDSLMEFWKTYPQCVCL